MHGRGVALCYWYSCQLNIITIVKHSARWKTDWYILFLLQCYNEKWMNFYCEFVSGWWSSQSVNTQRLQRVQSEFCWDTHCTRCGKDQRNLPPFSHPVPPLTTTLSPFSRPVPPQTTTLPPFTLHSHLMEQLLCAPKDQRLMITIFMAYLAHCHAYGSLESKMQAQECEQESILLYLLDTLVLDVIRQVK